MHEPNIPNVCVYVCFILFSDLLAECQRVVVGSETIDKFDHRGVQPFG